MKGTRSSSGRISTVSWKSCTVLFPEEKDGLRAFYADLYKLYENIVIKNEIISPPSEFSPRQGLRRLMSAPFAMLRMQKLLSTSTMDLLKKYFHTPEIFDFFDKLCSAYAYTTAEETPAVLAATMFIDNHIGGVYFPGWRSADAAQHDRKSL